MGRAGRTGIGRLGWVGALGLALWAGTGAPGLAIKPAAPGSAQPQTELKSYLGRLSVLAPEHHDGLTLYPIAAKGDFALAHLLTLDEALSRKALVVTELAEGAQVNTLLLENVSTRPIFVMAGEILRGAKQDRTMQNDLLIPPKSGKMKVSVFCTEHGRWVENSKAFESADQAVPNSVRQAAKVEKSQRRVWRSIEQNQDKLNASAPTAAAKDVYAAPHVQRDLKPFLDRLSGLSARHAGVVGVVAAYGDRLVAVDVFGDDDLFRRLYPKLLRSYVVDVLNDKAQGRFGANDARALLASATGGSWVRQGTEGVGAALALSQARTHGSALIDAPSTIHADVFVGEISREPEEAPIPNIEQRRNR